MESNISCFTRISEGVGVGLSAWVGVCVGVSVAVGVGDGVNNHVFYEDFWGWGRRPMVSA